MCKMKLVISGLLLIVNAATIESISPALILTPLIKNNQANLARNVSTVDSRYFLNVTSHSGFITVDEKYNSNVFFWYFPVADKAVEDTPWIIWLQGGPGASSIAGLFDEVGPFEYADGKLKLRESAWTKGNSVLFIDNPIGAGFSFTNSKDGFITDMATCATHLYKVLQQITTIFPELRSAPLYLAGESYAGRYLPALGLKILHQDSDLGHLDVNMQGIIMGNPVLNREVISDYRSYFQQWGLIDSQGSQAVKPLQDAFIKAIKDHDSNKAVDLRNQLLDRLDDMAMQQQNFNILEDDLQKEIKGFTAYITHVEVREALHTGNIKFTFSNGTVHEKLKGDFVSEVSEDMAKLLDHYRILIYCGQLDLTAPCVPNAQDRRKNWHWSQRDYFLKAPRTPWWYNNSVAGYVKSGGSLTEVLVRGAGHLVPMDKPEQLLKLVDFFIRGLDMPYPPNYIVGANNTPEYKVPDMYEKQVIQTIVSSSPGTKIAMTVSIVINVILVLGILAGVVYSLRLKHRVQLFSYNNMEETTINDGVLSMS